MRIQVPCRCVIVLHRMYDYENVYYFIYLFIQFINQQWHRSTNKEHTGRKANTGFTNHLCAAKKINKKGYIKP